MTESNTPDDQTELAKERNRIAAERTLLTWVRTTVSFIGLGFGLWQLLPKIEMSQSQRAPALVTDFLSFLLMGMGVSVVIAAALDYQSELRRLRQPGYVFHPRSSLALIVGSIVAIAAIITWGVFWYTPISV